jgi:hypothetical protein
MKVLFDREDIINQLDNLEFIENAVPIFARDNAGFLNEEDQREILDKAAQTVLKWYDTKFLMIEANNKLAKKKNGKFRKGSVITLIDINIARYVTDFTSCWYHKRIALRAIDEDTVEVVLEGTQTTH